MSQKIIIPLSIIIFGGLALGGIWLGQQLGGGKEAPLELAGANLRQLELSVPGMFCAGCTASVENYTAAVPGVKRVEARLTPTKSATVVYDPAITDPQTIIANQIFDVYGVAIIEDKPYAGQVSLQPAAAADVPQEIQTKSRQVVELLRQQEDRGQDTSTARSLLQQVNRFVENSDFIQASIQLDTILRLLKANN